MDNCYYVLFIVLIVFFNSSCYGEEAGRQNNDGSYQNSFLFDTRDYSNDEVLLYKAKEELTSISGVPDGVIKWHIISHENSSTAVVHGEDWISFVSENHSSSVRRFDGEITAVALHQSKNGTTLAVAAEVQQDSTTLHWFRVNGSKFEVVSDLGLPIIVDHLAIFEDNLLLTTRISLDIFKVNYADPQRMGLLERITIDAPVEDIVAIRDGASWYFALSLLSLDRVDVFKVNDLSECGKYISKLTSIATENPATLTTFHVGASAYLAVSGADPGIWLFKKDSSLIRVSTYQEAVEAWLAVPLDTYRNDVLLLAQKNGSVFAAHSDAFLSLEALFCAAADVECPEILKKLTLTEAGAARNTVILPSVDGKHYIFELKTDVRPIEGSSTIFLQDMELMKQKLEIQLEDLELESAALLSNLTDIFNTSASINESTYWNLEKLYTRIAEFDSSDELSTFLVGSTIFAGQNWTIEDSEIDLQKLEDLLVDLGSDIHEMSEEIKDELLYDENILDQLPEKISGTFSIEGGVLYVQDLIVDEINGYNVNEWLSDSFRLDNPKPITGVKTFEDLSVSSIEFENINEIPADKLLFSGDPTISGDLVFKGDVTILENLMLPPDGTVNGINLAQDLIRVDSFIEGSLEFESLNIEEGIHIDGYMNDVPVILPAHYSLSEIDMDSVKQSRVEHLNILENLDVDFINGVDIRGLLTDERKYHNLTVSDLNIEYLNGHKFPEDFVLPSCNSSTIVTGKKYFHNLQVGDFHTNWANHLPEENQVNDGKSARDEPMVYEFNNLEIIGPIIVDVVNNQTWKDWNDVVRKDQETALITSHKHFTQSVLFENLNLDEVVNNSTIQILTDPEIVQSLRLGCRPDLSRYNVVPIADIENEIDSLDESEFMNQFEVLDVEELEVYGSIRTFAHINGFDAAKIKKNYLSKKKPQTLPNSSFSQSVNILNKITVRSINGIDQSLTGEDAFKTGKLSNITQLTVEGDFTTTLDNPDLYIFKDFVQIEQLTLGGLISGLNTTELYNDAVFGDEDCILSGKKIFTKDLLVNNAQFETMNGRKLSLIATHHGRLEFEGPISIEGNLHVMESMVVEGNLNGVNVTALTDYISPSHGAYVVKGDLIMGPGVEINNLVVQGEIQGMNFEQFVQDVIKKDEDFEMEGNALFTHTVTFEKNLTIEENLNKLNLSEFFEDIVLLDQPASLQDVIFKNNTEFEELVVEQSLKVPSLNNISTQTWQDDCIPIDDDIFVPGVTKFSDVIIHGNAQVGVINNITLASVIPLDTDQVLPITLRLENLTINSNLNVGGRVNGLHLPTAFKDTLMRKSLSQNVTGAKSFKKDLSVSGDVDIDIISGRKLSEMVTLDTEQTIWSDISFENEVIVHEDLLADGLIGGVDVKEWDARVFFPDRNQTLNGTWTVLGNITVRKDITGSGLVLAESIADASNSLFRKRKAAIDIQNQMEKDYLQSCFNLQKTVESSMNLSRKLDAFEEIQGIEYAQKISAIITYNISRVHYLLAPQDGRCTAPLYEWDPFLGKFSKISSVAIGPVNSWETIYVPDFGLYLLSSEPRSAECLSKGGSLWLIDDGKPRFIEEIPEFVDVLKEKESALEFYTLTKEGPILWYSLEGGKLRSKEAFKAVPGAHHFLPYTLGVGIAVWDGNAIKLLQDYPQPLKPIRLAGGSVAVTFLNGGRDSIAALTDLHEDIIIVKNINFASSAEFLHIRKPSDILWLDIGSPGELYLVFSSDHQKIQIYQFKGVAGFRYHSTLHFASTKLVAVNLPHSDLLPTPHIVVVKNNQFRLIKVEMHGQPRIDINVKC